jgi:hypothetical protein
MESATSGTEWEESEAEFETLGWKRKKFFGRFDGVWRVAGGSDGGFAGGVGRGAVQVAGFRLNLRRSAGLEQ